jgi:hypothetical protein
MLCNDATKLEIQLMLPTLTLWPESSAVQRVSIRGIPAVNPNAKHSLEQFYCKSATQYVVLRTIPQNSKATIPSSLFYCKMCKTLIKSVESYLVTMCKAIDACNKFILIAILFKA